jgi:putative transposase
VKFRLIDAEKANFPLELMCRVAEVSRSGFYAWQRRPKSKRAVQDEKLTKEIEKVFASNSRRYGSPRIHKALKADGHDVSRKRVARLMQEQGIEARPQRNFRVTTDSNHDSAIAPNLLERRFDVTKANSVWASDITYIKTGEGWLYLAMVIDLYSRRIVGWAMRDHMETELCTSALQMALTARRPSPGLIHHSDRGTQYASSAYRALLDKHGLRCSMSRRADCWDNAVAESFFSTLKAELVESERFATHSAARMAVFRYIEGYYNLHRLHSTLGYCSPARFEVRTAA